MFQRSVASVVTIVMNIPRNYPQSKEKKKISSQPSSTEKETQCLENLETEDKEVLEGLMWAELMGVEIKSETLYHKFSSVIQSFLTLCDPIDCTKPGLPVHHQLLEFIQTHVHRIGDPFQPSHSLSSPSHPAFNLSQHQGLFK